MASWKAGTILVNKDTGKMLRVLFSYRGAVAVVDLNDASNPSTSKVLLERDYESWQDEKKMEAKVLKKGDSWFAEKEIVWTQL